MRIAAVFLFVALLHAQTGGSAEGTVTNAVTHAPIAGVAVTLWTPQAVRYYATTDNSGAWRITDMQPGRYRSRYEKDGFFEPPRDSPGLDPMIAVVPGGNPARLDAQLTPLATVRGRVLDSEGKPAPDVDVSFLMYSTTAKTDAEGQFVIPDVRPGSYQLLAKPQPSKVKPTEVKPTEGERIETVPTYYPSSTDRTQAAVITIRGGEDLPGFDIRLRTAPVYRLRGKLFDEAGNPSERATVRLLSISPEKTFGGQMSFDSMRFYFGTTARQMEEASTVSGEDGTFEFPSVRSGDWTLTAQTDPKRGADRNFRLSWSGNIPVTVSDHGLDDVQIRFPPTFTLEAQIDYGDRPLPDDVRNFPLPVVLYSLDEGGAGVPRMPNRAGNLLRFVNVTPGRYRIVPLSGFPPGYYVASVRVAGQEVLGQPVTLNPGIPPVQIIYKPNAGAVRGIVDNGEGATVLLWPQSGSVLEMARAVQTGPGGAFHIESLPPGAYSLVALDTKNPEKLSEDVLRGVSANATSVQVDEAASPSVNLNLTHVP